jgi:Brp/Blh family beta-carotene 15,15'-monooxygenase
MGKLHFTQIYLAILGLSILALLLNIELSSVVGIAALAIAVVILGLPHGALDFAVAKSLNYVTGVHTACRFLAIYTAVAGASIVFWTALPGTALSLFLGISIFHFAADWRTTMPLYARLCLSAMVLCGPSIVHSAIVVTLFTALFVSSEVAVWIIHAMQIIFAVAFLGFVYFVIAAVINKNIKSGWQVTEWIALITSSIVLTPLLHFALYFCVLHSPKHLFDVSKILRLSFIKVIVISLPFVLLTLLLAWVLFAVFANDAIDTELLRWTFIGLFGLTMSHMMLIHLWHRTR